MWLSGIYKSILKANMDYISTLMSQPGSPAFTESSGSDIEPNYKGKFKIHNY